MPVNKKSIAIQQQLVESLMRRRQVPGLARSRTGGETSARRVKRETSVATRFAMDAKNRMKMRLYGVRRPAAALLRAPGIASINFAPKSVPSAVAPG